MSSVGTLVGECMEKKSYGGETWGRPLLLLRTLPSPESNGLADDRSTLLDPTAGGGPHPDNFLPGVWGERGGGFVVGSIGKDSKVAGYELCQC